MARVLLSKVAVWATLTSLLRCANGATEDQAYQFNAVAVTGGGYITGIIAHPKEQNLLYARTDIGGAYRWDQSLNKWVPLNDFVSAADSNLLGTESMAVDPQDPEKLYLAQGRYLTSNNSAFFVSNDQGRSFEIYDAPFPMGSNELGRNNGERLAVNPYQTNELWMGTRSNGLFKSTDGAKTWTNVTAFPNAFANTIGIVSVVFDPKHEGTIYVSACVPNGIYVTHNGGKTWKTVPGQPTSWDNSTLYAGEDPYSTGPQPMKVALATNNVLYVTYADYPGPYGAQYGYVYKYNVSSGEWTNITPDKDNSSPAPYSPQSFPAGGFCGLTLDAKDPETLVVVTLDRDPGPALDSMYLTYDGGKSWKDVSQLSTPSGSGGYWGHPIDEAKLKNGTKVSWLSFDWAYEWGGYGAPSPVKGLTKFGWWMTAVLMDPFNPKHVMYGTGATIWATDDINNVDSNKAPNWYVQAQGIEETYALSAHVPTGGDAHLFSGFGDICGMKHKDLDNPEPMYGLPTFSNLDSIDSAGKNPNVVVRIGDSGNYTGYDGCGSGAYSTDNGETWSVFPTCPAGINTTVTTLGIVAVDASGKHIVWSTEFSYKASSDQSGPWATSNFGKTWTAPSGLSVQTANISADRVQASTFYSFTSGVWYVSTDGGVSYESSKATSIGLPSSAVGAVPVASFLKAGELWLPLGDLGVYHSTNFGRSWRKLPGTISPDFFTIGAPAQSGSITPALFLWGTMSSSGVDGLYRSDDGGESWVRVNDNDHQYGGPTLILGDPRVYGRVFIGTAGRGIVRADLASGRENVAGTGGM